MIYDITNKIIVLIFHDSTNCWLITNSWVIFISPTKLVILSTGLSLRCHGEMY